jgi:glutathione synthase/RimK-type ligase-like ATP-grasp enzyme
MAGHVFDNLKKIMVLKRLQKTMNYSRIRQFLPMSDVEYVDDRDKIDDAEIVRIEWPKNIEKPHVGVVRDFGIYPRWTKYCRFLENNSFPYVFYDIHAHDWIENAKNIDAVVGLVSNEFYRLEELQKKYHFLETYLGKKCFPSTAHAVLYEDKSFEAYLAEIFELPFAKTLISHQKEDALAMIDNLRYPLVSKISPAAGSIGVELLRTPRKARRVIRQAFSRNGRKVHVPYFRQKNYVYFQEFIPNDGYDIRVILVGNWVFGYYRKVLSGDFRASGMHPEEKRALPEEAIRIALKANKFVQSPLLVVDMVHGLDGSYTITEFSPVCQLDSPEELRVDGIPGAYIIHENGQIRFKKGRYWVAELSIKEFLLHYYLPSLKGKTD